MSGAFGASNAEGGVGPAYLRPPPRVPRPVHPVEFRTFWRNLRSYGDGAPNRGSEEDVGGDLKQKADAELMELVKTGDFRAFDELYARYAPGIRRFLFSLTWDDDAADDATQEVFCKLFKARNAYRPTGKLSQWLFRTAKNHFISRCRKERSNGQAPIQLYESIRANPKVEPDIHLLEQYRRHSIRRAVAALPPGQRLVFVMSEIEGMKYAEIAEMLSIPVGTVKSRMFAAVAALRQMLEGEI